MSNIAIQDLRCVRWTLDNPDTGVLKATILNWKEAETEKGRYDFAVVTQAIASAQQLFRSVQLRIHAELPAWSKDTVHEFISFIHALGSAFDQHPVLFSIDLTLPETKQDDNNALTSIADAYLAAFPQTYILANINCDRMISYLKGKPGIGLVFDANKNASTIGEQLVRLSQQRTWEKAPIRMIADDLSKNLLEEAIRWHVSSIDTSGKYDAELMARIGYRIELRRVAIQSSALPNETIPLSAWIVNSGNAPCYSDARFRLYLSRADSDDGMVTKTSFIGKDFYPGEDNVLSESITLSNLPTGDYDVQLGLFEDKTDYPVSLGIEGRISDGYYAALILLAIQS